MNWTIILTLCKMVLEKKKIKKVAFSRSFFKFQYANDSKPTKIIFKIPCSREINHQIKMLPKLTPLNTAGYFTLPHSPCISLVGGVGQSVIFHLALAITLTYLARAPL